MPTQLNQVFGDRRRRRPPVARGALVGTLFLFLAAPSHAHEVPQPVKVPATAHGPQNQVRKVAPAAVPGQKQAGKSEHPSATGPRATHWRLTNLRRIADHWVVSELLFYADAKCTQSLHPLVEAVIYSASYDDPQGTNAEVVHDGKCNSAPGFEPGAHWAGADSAAGQAPRGTYLGYRFSQPVEVKCIETCQSPMGFQQVLKVMLQAGGGNDGWADVAPLTGTGVSDTYIRFRPGR
jgi:hypothetical protein